MQWIILVSLGGLLGFGVYLLMSIVSLGMQLEALRLDLNAVLKKLTGRTDGASLSEALDKTPNSITALQQFLDEQKGGIGERANR